MAWYFDTIRIFPQEFTDEGSQEIAALNPLGGGTLHQIFGWSDLTKKLTAYIVGYTDKDAIEARRKTALTYVISGPWGDLGDYYLKNTSIKATNITCQTLRPDLPEDSPVFMASLELWLDE